MTWRGHHQEEEDQRLPGWCKKTGPGLTDSAALISRHRTTKGILSVDRAPLKRIGICARFAAQIWPFRETLEQLRPLRACQQPTASSEELQVPVREARRRARSRASATAESKHKETTAKEAGLPAGHRSTGSERRPPKAKDHLTTNYRRGN